MSSFDYIICGGGLAGLVLANRLSEDPQTTVCVLEAGTDVTNAADTQIPGLLFKNSLNDQILWKFNTIPQPHAKARSIYLARGKALGGSSVVNYLGIGRGHKEEYDALEKLGAKGWNWENLLGYFKKSETFTLTEEQKTAFPDIKFDPNYDGQSGAWHRSLVPWTSSLHDPCMRTLLDAGLRYNTAPFNGDNSGVWLMHNGVHPTKVERSSSASSYYEPVKSRSNLHIILDAQVTKIILKEGSGENYVAEAVEFVKNGEIQQVVGRKEIILSAGAHQSSQILELSGIGDKKAWGTIYEHFWSPHIAEVDPAHETLDILLSDPERAAAEYQQYLSTKRGLLTAGTGGTCWAFLQTHKFMDEAKLSGISLKEDNVGIRVQKDWLKSPTVPQLEILPLPIFLPSPKAPTPELGKRYLTTLTAILHPIARGSVHISSSDPLAHPTIDLATLDNPTDIIMLREGIKFARKIYEGQSFIKAEVLPGKDVQTDEEIDEFIRQTVQTVNHPIATASMLPRKDGGVVDHQLKVYGTENLRVVDASIIPLQISAHTQATVYAIAEKAADLIRFG